MKKSFLILILFAFPNCFSQSASAADTYSEPIKLENLKGKIKTLTEIWYPVIYKFGEIQKEKVWSEQIYKYNIKGNEIEKISNDYRYEMYVKYRLKYNNSAKVTEKSVYGLNQELWKKFISKYDQLGDRIEETRYNSDGSFDFKNTYKYENGNIISVAFFDNDNNYQTTSASYEYNDKNQKIKEFDGWKEYSFEYDDFGNETKKMSGEEIIEINKYDNKNNIIESINPSSDGNDDKYTYQYKYDKIGNWLKKVIFHNEKAIWIIERKIEYYM